MPPSTADAPIITSLHFRQKQILNGLLDEQPGDSNAPTGADKLLKPEGGIAEERILKKSTPLFTTTMPWLIHFFNVTVTYLFIHKLASELIL